MFGFSKQSIYFYIFLAIFVFTLDVSYDFYATLLIMRFMSTFYVF